MPEDCVYKIAPETVWREAQAKGEYLGSGHDQRDGFIHFSLRDQLEGTLAKHYQGQRHLLLIEFRAADLGSQLKYEPSRGGQLFPHLYGLLDPALAVAEWALEVDQDGNPTLPVLGG